MLIHCCYSKKKASISIKKHFVFWVFHLYVILMYFVVDFDGSCRIEMDLAVFESIHSGWITQKSFGSSIRIFYGHIS